MYSFKDEKYYSQLTSNVNIIVDESSKKGRKVIATDNFKKGEVVFVETPIASFPSPEVSNFQFILFFF